MERNLTCHSDRYSPTDFSRVSMPVPHACPDTRNSICIRALPAHPVFPSNRLIFLVMLEDPIKSHNLQTMIFRISTTLTVSIFFLIDLYSSHSYQHFILNICLIYAYLNIIFRVNDETASLVYEFLSFVERLIRLVVQSFDVSTFVFGLNKCSVNAIIHMIVIE